MTLRFCKLCKNKNNDVLNQDVSNLNELDLCKTCNDKFISLYENNKFIKKCNTCCNLYFFPIDKKNQIRKCLSCAQKEAKNNPEFWKKMKAENRIKNAASNGLTLHDVWVRDFGKEVADEKERIHKELKKTSISGNKNPMAGRSVYSRWLEKYGKEEADIRKENFSKKISKAISGSGNPMYGKPSPAGSGNGWSGWYKDWHFRSLGELSFMIKVIERFKFKWESGELKKYRVKYKDWEDVDRTYSPDFVLNDKYMVECKPKKLWNSKGVKDKKKAGILKCKELGLKYKLMEIPKLTEDEIYKLWVNKEIKFIERYDKKFLEKYDRN